MIYNLNFIYIMLYCYYYVFYPLHFNFGNFKVIIIPLLSYYYSVHSYNITDPIGDLLPFSYIVIV